MSLNMYLGEVKSQTQSMNAFCTTVIQGMEQAVYSINTFVNDIALQGKTYDTAKTFFAQTYRPLAQGIIYLCEELIRQNDAFPNDFQSQVATTDVIEQEILEQIQEIERMIISIEAMSQSMPSMQIMLSILISMKRKLQEKLERLYAFNQTSSNNYDTALQLASSISQGLAEIQNGNGFNPTTGTFSTQGLNMGWAMPIQKIIEKKTHEADKNKIKFFTGNAEWKDKGRVGGVLEGSVVDSKESIGNNNEWNMKALSGKLDLNVPYSFDAVKDDLIAGNIIGAKIEGSALENSFKAKVPNSFKVQIPIVTYIGPIVITPKEITITQKFFEGNFAAGVEQYTGKFAAELTAHKYEAELKLFYIPDFVPFIGNHDVIAKGEVGLGTYGLRAKLGNETGLYYGEEFGLGGFIKFEKTQEEN